MATKPERSAFAVPTGRLSRLARLGSLASGVAGGMLAEGARQLAGGRRPRVGELLLTPANARRVAEQLAQMRGAAMKVGQLLSMDGGDLLPPELSEILSRLRSDARPMPMSQLVPVLAQNWGEGWERHFRRFSFTPMAAASIGQVHAAEASDGSRLAIKVQYPGVRQSIASDIDNVAGLLRISGLLPKTLDVSSLLEAAKQQLHEEADYLSEAFEVRHRHAVLEMITLACEPLRQAGPFDFGRSDLSLRMRDAGVKLGLDRDFWHIPPVDTLFLHRKLGGLYLLAARLKARVDVRALFAPHAGSRAAGE
ncbi:AarF/UbiB family protein [Zoogloea sp. LCSB751]|uniref:AarF/UbiB family protein n=1 Tax=Zoogloea sp. LCSB751 TaxID=1965277 RepID=UPI0009A50878|nr:AarF/UbiB family protein [Zoogloea sp. LCSB751]